MVNRLEDYFEEPEERTPESDFFIVSAEFDSFYVSEATAIELMRTLERSPSPGWVRFTEINGSRVCLRTRMIHYVSECTQRQRAAERAFHRARRQEEKADRRPWEDDD